MFYWYTKLPADKYHKSWTNESYRVTSSDKLNPNSVSCIFLCLTITIHNIHSVHDFRTGVMIMICFYEMIIQSNIAV